MKKNENKEIDLSRYKDRTGLTLQKMNFGLWLSKNRKLLLQIIIGFLLIISAFFIIYSSYNYVKYFIEGRQTSSHSNDANDNVISPRNITKNIVVSNIGIFQNKASYDLAVKLTNPNDKFIAYFSYCFTQEDKEISCGNNFILPHGEKYILSLNQRSVVDKATLKFILKKTSWQRINSRQIPDWLKFKNEHFNFSVEKLAFASAARSGLSDKLGLNTLSFTITNDSAYGFYSVPLNILLFNGTDLVGVNQYLVTNFLANQKVAVKIVWPDRLPQITRAEIVPEINILDANVYSKYTGQAGN